MFVANRIQTIRYFSLVNQWQHVSTDRNPADCGSRGMTAEEFIDNPIWIRGPEFLWRSTAASDMTVEDSQDNIIGMLTEPAELGIVHDLGRDVLNRLRNAYLRWRRLVKAAVYLKRFCDFLKERFIHKWSNQQLLQKYNKNPVSLLEFQASEGALITWLQHVEFTKEYEWLLKIQHSDQTPVGRVSRDSSVRALDPIMEDGFIKVGGRLNKSDLSASARNPILLPRKNHMVWSTCLCTTFMLELDMQAGVKPFSRSDKDFGLLEELQQSEL